MKKTTFSQWNTLSRWNDNSAQYLGTFRRSNALLLVLVSLSMLLCACAQTTQPSTSYQSNSPGIYVATISYSASLQGTMLGISKLDIQTHKLLWHIQPALSADTSIGFQQQLIVTGDHVYLGFFAFFNRKSSLKDFYTSTFVYSFSTRDGKELWHTESEPYKYPAHLGLWLITPTTDNKTIYIASTMGKVSALDARNGSLRWTYDTKMEGIFCGIKDGKCSYQYIDSIAISQPTIAHSIIYGSIKNRFYALDAAKGTLLWSHDLPAGQIIMQPVALDGKLASIVACTTSIDRRVCSLSTYTADNGLPVWHTGTLGNVLSPLTIWDHKIYAVSQSVIDSSTKVYAWNSTDGKLLWHYETPGNATLLVVNNQVYLGQYVFDDRKRRYLCNRMALDTVTGTIRWQSPQSYECSLLRAADDHTLYALYENLLFAYKATDGSKRWQYTFPAVSGYRTTSVAIVVISPSP